MWGSRCRRRAHDITRPLSDGPQPPPTMAPAMRCPHCGHEQTAGTECEGCGVIFNKWKPQPDAAVAEPGQTSPLDELLHDLNVLRLNENPRGTLSMLTGWEPAREFDIVDSIGRARGTAAEQGRGVFAGIGRSLFSQWLAVQFSVFTFSSQRLAMTLRRPFFWFFSTMTVDGPRGERLGTVTRRFSLVRKRYELRDGRGQTFATIETPLLHPWTYPVFDRTGQQRAEIAKRWAGMAEEMITGAQKFRVDFMNTDWPLTQRAVILATALSIDFDSFESRRNRSSAFGVVSAVDELLE